MVDGLDPLILGMLEAFPETLVHARRIGLVSSPAPGKRRDDRILVELVIIYISRPEVDMREALTLVEDPQP